MDRRDTLKTIGTIGAASAFGIGAGGTGLADAQDEGGDGNPGRVGTYNGNRSLVPPDLGGFDEVLLFLADGEPDGDWDGVAQAERFQREVMGRDTAAIVDDRNAAVEFYAERFGLDFPAADEGDLFASVDTQDGVAATLEPAMVDPAVGTTAYVISGRGMPNNYGDGTTETETDSTGKVREGGWRVTVDEAATLGGTYGEGGPSDVAEGAQLAFGNYNVRMGDDEDPIVVHYESEHPIPGSERVPVAFNYDLSHEEWGEGQVHGTMGGTMAPGIRTVLTFPPAIGSGD